MNEQQQHPITPPEELVEQWARDMRNAQHFATQAARWGADQELEACCEWVEREIGHGREWGAELRASRRPKPPSLAEEALVACERSAFGIPGDRDIIRRALERLQELEKGDE